MASCTTHNKVARTKLFGLWPSRLVGACFVVPQEFERRCSSLVTPIEVNLLDPTEHRAFFYQHSLKAEGIMRYLIFISTLVLSAIVIPAVRAEAQQNSLPVDASSTNEERLLKSKRKGTGSQTEASTVGLAAPSGAVVLFDGANFDAWKPFSFQWINPKDDQKEVQWKLVDGEAMQIAFEFKGKRRKQFLCTKEKFVDYRLHLEFQLPVERSGNSGVFFGALYELQIFNSEGKESPGLGDCGAIYQIRVPDVSAGLGASVWQSIDLEFQAAKFGANGFMSEANAARVTVRLNGKLIHDDVKLSLRRNKYAAFPEEPLSPIVLQEHGSPVKFRNIWVVNKTASVNKSMVDR
ncbi:3-keto-disaccharide hydrolase [Rubripirellula reticaptiva]|uniref:3-keto-alpha-glucoside-1,2-lyase/3-keto-2-hydroxy-glucal hydratase domain-containing protein n=1 Tax=Rubripirellula reticaptiva TaxID=2528013 RepID=A0A5C6EI61_9BACT|nr:DUF1080 domain-containing protein [Rubripirellula reticaptiva]TWU46939.1 hypothetical protein Poly59_59130 [Rubripirellula reticaptiva]